MIWGCTCFSNKAEVERDYWSTRRDTYLAPETKNGIHHSDYKSNASADSICSIDQPHVIPVKPLTISECSSEVQTDGGKLGSHDSIPCSSSTNDVPKIDSGVRMLCMDGGGAKGVIEATILDKIFVTVASTLKYEVHLLNWLTIVIDRDVKEDKKKKKDKDKELILVREEKEHAAVDSDSDRKEKMPETRSSPDNKISDKKVDYILSVVLSALNGGNTKKMYKRVLRVDRTRDLSDRRQCIVISGVIDQNDMFIPLTHAQKVKLLKDDSLRKFPGMEVKDFLHGASKYWVLLDSDQSDETRDKIKNDISSAFSYESRAKKEKTVKCIKMLVPAQNLVLKGCKAKEELEKKDLLVFYWDQPVKTKHANIIRDKLLGLDNVALPNEHYHPSKFIEELHASEMFDLLIGTSTGSILAFGMGYKGLSPQECRDVYLKSIKNIFSTKYDKSSTGKLGLGDTLFRTVGDLVGQGHYSIDGVWDTLETNYNVDNPTTKMGGGSHRQECVCACVALNWETQTLETFDTHNARYREWGLIQFLTASSDAPVYFTTPFTVKSPAGKGTDYIDGGLGASCPAVQGINLAKERWRDAEIELILSLGAGKDINPPALPRSGGDWLKTLCTMVTDGDNIWQRFVLPLLEIDEACKHTEKLRIQPRMELAQFKADSIRVLDMCNMAETWLNTAEGFTQVTEAAGMIIAKSLKLKVETRILTEQDLLDWLAQTLPIGKSLFKSRKQIIPGDQTQGIIDDSLDMKFGRELHSLNLLPNDKLKKRFPAMEKKFVYIPKPVSVGQTDLRFTVKFDHSAVPAYDGTHGQLALKLHCPDNHEVRIVCNLDLYDSESVFRISNLVTVPLSEIEQFHRLVHEASKEISQLGETDRIAAEEKLCSAMGLLELPGYKEIGSKYTEEHFMRIQAYFYLWKRTVSEVSLKVLNETLIKVGMKKRPWPMRGKLGEPDVTVRTVIPAPPENMMFSIAVEYFQDRLAKAAENKDKEAVKRYSEFMMHLGAHPAKKEAELGKYKKKFFNTVFKTKRKDGKGSTGEADLISKPAIRKKPKVRREEAQAVSDRNGTAGKTSFLKGTKKFFNRNRKETCPEKLESSPYGSSSSSKLSPPPTKRQSFPPVIEE